MSPTLFSPTSNVINSSSTYLTGLKISYLSLRTLMLSSGAASNSTDDNDIILPSSVIMNGLKSGPNGVDVGIFLGSKTYAVYVIGDSTGYQPTAGIFSLNTTQPVLPFGYDMYRRVGWVSTDPSVTILKFFQNGTDETRDYYYDSQGTAILFSGNSTSYFPLSLSPAIPAIRTEVSLLLNFNCSDPSHYVSLRPFGSTESEGLVIFGMGIISQNQFTTVTMPCRLDTNGVPSISYKVGGTLDRITIRVFGYKDYL